MQTHLDTATALDNAMPQHAGRKIMNDCREITKKIRKHKESFYIKISKFSFFL